MIARFSLILCTLIAAVVSASSQTEPESGERVVMIGNGLGERMNYYPYFETLLHLRYPAKNLVVRNMSKPGDTAGFRPHAARKSQWAFPGAEAFHPGLKIHRGQGFFPTPDEWLTSAKADTIIAFFGYNESFAGPDGLKLFTDEIDAFVVYTLAQKYNGQSAPRLVLVSPTAFEDLSSKLATPDGVKENKNLALYTEAMRSVAEKHQVGFVDVLTPTLKLAQGGNKDFTINGFLLSDWGYRQFAQLLADGVFGKSPVVSKANPEVLTKAVLEKDWMWANDYYILNSVHAYGRRYEPYGPANYPDEIKKTREMVELRDQRIHEIAQAKTSNLEVNDSQTHPLPPVVTNFNKPIKYLPGDESLETFKLPEGFKIEVFASEKEFPDLKKPVQMSFDNKGRLWVAVTPSYPHYRPGGDRPNDKLLIFEDTDGDGRADKQTVFADGLYLPLGFELTAEGVYVSEEPNLAILIDDNGDDRADRKELILHGFDTHDSHHAIHAFDSDASGAFYMGEGIFLHSQVETPYGPQRVSDGGIWRFDPKSFRLERYSQTEYENPWGISHDDWDQTFISDASNGNNWWALPISAKMPHGMKISKTAPFAPKRARPTAGAGFISSRHFPDDYQGRYLLNNSIGFLGTSMHEVWDDESGFSGKHVGDLISSSDANVRLVDLEFGPDGSLFLVDWHNALIGHMQHNARDPNRDSTHGRIYRVTYPARPLVKPAKVAGASISELLENLKLPEYRTRYRTRRELRGRPADEVVAAVKTWVTGLDKSDPRYEHHLCEALWATWAHRKVDPEILQLCLNAKSFQARAAAVSVVRFAFRDIPNSSEILMKAANDDHGRVRLEAIVAGSWMDNENGALIVLEALKKPVDKWMGKVTEEILNRTLNDDIEVLKKANRLHLENNPAAAEFVKSGKLVQETFAESPKEAGPKRKLSPDEQAIYNKGKEVFSRDAHCITCHQADGKGLPNIYPPLISSEWVNGDEERFIKIVLKGLWGPIDVAGAHFDPAKGVPPMTGFGGILKDDEIAAVISYVRNSFGNEAPFVKPETVAKVRKETEAQQNFYMVEDLLKAHPLK
jgi:mono/diheme cytochrome c family protein/glucose/arabinose dehydrogenase